MDVVAAVVDIVVVGNVSFVNKIVTGDVDKVVVVVDKVVVDIVVGGKVVVGKVVVS